MGLCCKNSRNERAAAGGLAQAILPAMDCMHYENIVPGVFLERPNRFIARVGIAGAVETVHVKNTGRCRELLTPGATVWCQAAVNPLRKTRWDLIAVQKGDRLVNMDAQAPNAAALEWLRGGGLGPLEALRPETVHRDSRFDFSFRREGRPCLLEVKGVTLELDGVCAFPDAPTQRGAKHLHGLTQAAREGFGAYVLFVIQMENIRYFRPYAEADPAFAAALREAAAGGVTILAYTCQVTPNSMEIDHPVEIRLE